jgi:hypothetical protein
MPNTLCYGNLVVLRNEIASDSVDLIYLDPQSIASYLECAAPLSGRQFFYEDPGRGYDREQRKLPSLISRAAPPNSPQRSIALLTP